MRKMPCEMHKERRLPGSDRSPVTELERIVYRAVDETFTSYLE